MKRRVVALVLAFVLFVTSGVIAFAEGQTEYEYASYGCNFSDYLKNGAFDVTLSYSNSGSENLQLKAIAAVYSSGDLLKHIKIIPFTLEAGGTSSFDISFDLSDIESEDYIKVFTWNGDGFDSLNPYTISSRQSTKYSSIKSYMKRVNNYWQAMNPDPGDYKWNRAVYHTGNMEAYYMTGYERYVNYSIKWAEKNNWKGATATDPSTWRYSYDESQYGVLFGDNQICFQTYIDLYNLEPDEKKIARAIEVMDYQIATSNEDYLWWIDGLYMLLPILSKLYLLTGNETYLDKQYIYFKYARNNFQDTEDKLWYRDESYIYPKKVTANGNKVFWSRGNGWVVGAHVKILQDLPDNSPYKAEYIESFKQLIDALVKIQRPEGYWTGSLFDYEAAPSPESSGTMFFAYGLAYGINSGILDKDTYLPYLEKAWNWLTTSAVKSSGRLVYVQPIGSEPNPGADLTDSTQDFGVGEFMLVSSEMLKMSGQITANNLIPALKKKMVNVGAFKAATQTAYYNNSIITMDAPAIVTDNRSIAVPLTFVTNNIGTKVNNPSYAITAEVNNGNIVLTQNENTAEITAITKDGTTYADLSEVASFLGLYISELDNGLFILSHKENYFNSGYEQNLINLLEKIINDGEFPTIIDDGDDYGEETPEIDPDLGPLPEDAYVITSDMLSVNLEPEADIGNGKDCMIDRRLDTRWSAAPVRQGRPRVTVYPQATIDLGETSPISKIGLAFYQAGNPSRVSYFSVDVSNDGSTWTNIFNNKSSEPVSTLVYYQFPNVVSARYVRITGHGNSSNNYTSITELEICKPVSSGVKNTVTSLGVSVSELTVDIGKAQSALGLPKNITAYFDGGSVALIEGQTFNWKCENYDPNTEGIYTFVTDFSGFEDSLAALNLNPITITAEIKVEVKDIDYTTFVSVAPPKISSPSKTAGYFLEEKYSGIVTTEFDLTINESCYDQIVAYTTGTKNVGTYSETAAIIRFGTKFKYFGIYNFWGYIDCPQLPYPTDGSDAGQTYHIKFVMNTTTQLYQVWVTPPGGEETQMIATINTPDGDTFTISEFRFRNNVSDIGQICPWAGDGQPGGQFTITNHTVTVQDVQAE